MTRARDIADLAGGGTLLTRQLFTATAGQTTFTPSAGYNPGALEVFMNGLMLLASDYTATNSSTVVLGVAANAGDEVEILTYQINTIGDTVSASNGGTISSPITVNRNTTDGNIISLTKEGTTVGSIGSVSGVTSYIDGGSSFSGIQFGGDGLVPRDNGAIADNTSDLGTSSYRFKDAYLSGGIYLGGTGSANKLDDYEEGTFTPVMQGSGSNPSYSGGKAGRYTKVGNIVHFSAYVDMNPYTTDGSGSIYFTGLPFTVDGSNAGGTRYISMSIYGPTIGSGYSIVGQPVNNSNYLQFARWGDNRNQIVWTYSTASFSSGDAIYLQGHYYTNS